jgi:hypothetical protein
MLRADFDRAVWEASGWEDADPATVAEDAILGRLLALNRARSGATRSLIPLTVVPGSPLVPRQPYAPTNDQEAAAVGY